MHSWAVNNPKTQTKKQSCIVHAQAQSDSHSTKMESTPPTIVQKTAPNHPQDENDDEARRSYQTSEQSYPYSNSHLGLLQWSHSSYFGFGKSISKSCFIDVHGSSTTLKKPSLSLDVSPRRKYRRFTIIREPGSQRRMKSKRDFNC